MTHYCHKLNPFDLWEKGARTYHLRTAAMLFTVNCSCVTNITNIKKYKIQSNTNTIHSTNGNCVFLTKFLKKIKIEPSHWWREDMNRPMAVA